jgi:tRNA-splicing ligase RtcB (3'-phosphate/5'-hydroxy nucleic acid ligase)
VWRSRYLPTLRPATLSFLNMEIKARDLIAAGWPEGRRLGPARRRARDLESTGLARADVLTALEAEFPKQLAVFLPRYEPAPLAEAIEADTPEEKTNVAVARQRMTELLHVPVVKRGVIMPDACPTGGGRATVPVGGGSSGSNG